MNEDLTIQEVSFKEMTFVNVLENANSFLDVLIQGPISNQSYCQALIKKVLEINISDVVHLIHHHVHFVVDKFIWLNQFEQLIALNEKVFRKTKNTAKMIKVYTSIESKRVKLLMLSSVNLTDRPKAKYINAESEDRYFSFDQTVKKLKQIDDYCEQILFLTQEKHEYEQADLEFINQKLENFATQCQKKMEYLQHIRKLRIELKQENLNLSPIKNDFKKLQFNGNVNQLVDIFYQLSRELFVNGRSYLDGNVNDIAKMIAYSFVDKDGNKLSIETVKTILTPSREEKRPNNAKRVDVDKLL